MCTCMLLSYGLLVWRLTSRYQATKWAKQFQTWPLLIDMSQRRGKALHFYIRFLHIDRPLVDQELLTLLEHLSSPPVFSGVRVPRFLVLYVCFVAIVLSVLLRYTDSGCPFGIFKLFCNIAIHFYVRLTNIDESKDVAKQYVHFNIRAFKYWPVTRRIYRKQLYARLSNIDQPKT